MFHNQAENDVQYTIRRVVEDDAGSIVDLLNPIIEAGIFTIMDTKCSIKDQIDFIRGLPPRSIYNIALCSETGRALGIQDLIPVSIESRVLRHVGEVSTFISLEMRGRGIGSNLMETTCREALSLGFLKIMAMVRADNPQAVSFYKRQGFIVVGTARKHACFRNEYIDEIIMEHHSRYPEHNPTL